MRCRRVVFVGSIAAAAWVASCSAAADRSTPGSAEAHAADERPAGARVVVTGRVVDETGAPFAGAAVGLLPDGGDTEALLATPQATSAANGTFRVAAPGRMLALVALAHGRQACVVPHVWNPDGPTEIDLQLLPGARLVGRVTDAAGEPLAGALVEAMEPTPPRTIVRRRAAVATRTDAAGRFSLHGAARTGLRVRVVLPGWFEHVSFAHAGAPLHVALMPSGFVRGRVLDDAGAPRAGVALTVPWGTSVRSAEDGTFECPVARRGRFRISGHEVGPRGCTYLSDLLDGPGNDVVVRGVPEERGPSPASSAPLPAAASSDARALAVTWPELPEGGPASLLVWTYRSASRSFPLGPERRLRVQREDAGSLELAVVRASRVRLAEEHRFEALELAGDVGSVELAVAATAMTLVRGRVELPADVAPARVMVLCRSGRPDPGSNGVRSVAVAGLDRDGRFVLDLPPGSWSLELADCATRLVFHTERERLVVPGGPAEVPITPIVRWLDVEAGSLAFDYVRVTAGDPFGGVVWPEPETGDRAVLPFHDVGAAARWLVPHGHVSIHAQRERGAPARPGEQDIVGYAYVPAGAESARVALTPQPR